MLDFIHADIPFFLSFSFWVPSMFLGFLFKFQNNAFCPMFLGFLIPVHRQDIFMLLFYLHTFVGLFSSFMFNIFGLPVTCAFARIFVYPR